MPGGRGSAEDIATALNSIKHQDIADAFIMAIEQGEYEIQLSATVIGRAIDLCNHIESLTRVLCAAYQHKRANWEY